MIPVDIREALKGSHLFSELELDAPAQYQVEVGRVVTLEKKRLAIEHVGDVGVAPHPIELCVIQFGKQV